MNDVVASRRRWTGSSSSSRLLHFFYFLVYLLVSTAVSSEAKRSQPVQASSLAAQATAASIAGVGTPLEGYSLSSLVLVSAIDGSLTALDRSTGETRWNLDSQGSSFFSGGSAADTDALTDLSSSAFTPLVSTEYGKRHTSLAALLAGSGATDDGGRPGKTTQGGDREGFALDGLPTRTRHLLQAAGMYIVEPGSSGRLYLLTSRRGEDDDGSSPEGEAAFGQEAKARLQRVPLTLPELVGLSPFSFPGDKGRVFTGTKRTRLLRIDPLTGQLDRSWEADGSEMSSDSGYEDDNQRDDSRWAYLARTGELNRGYEGCRLSQLLTTFCDRSQIIPSPSPCRVGLTYRKHSTTPPTLLSRPTAKYRRAGCKHIQMLVYAVADRLDSQQTTDSSSCPLAWVRRVETEPECRAGTPQEDLLTMPGQETSTVRS